MWEGVPQSGGVLQCGRVCLSVGECSPVWEGVPQCGRVWSMWEGKSQCGRVCPSVGGCVPLWKGVSQYERMSPSVGRCAPVCVRVGVGVLVTCTYDRHTNASLCSSDCRTLRPRGEGLRG